MTAAGGLHRDQNAVNIERPSTPETVVVVSNVGRWAGGGVVGFREILFALRRLRPDLNLLAVVPQPGGVAKECLRNGIPTKVAWVPWWSFGRWGRLPLVDLHAVIGWVPYIVILLPGVLQAWLLFRRIRPAMVVTNTLTIPSHAIAAKLLGIPHYWVVREFGNDDHGMWFLFGYRRTIRLIAALSKSVICNSHAVESAMLSVEPTMKTSVLYPVVDTSGATPRQRETSERLRAVLVGQFAESKGQTLAIKAIAVARKRGVDIELTLIGGGRHGPLQKLARRLGVEDLLTIRGPTGNLLPHWAAAHVGLMCSRCEAFGRVTVEAMRAGLPICGTDSGGTPEIVEDEVTGLLSPPGDAAALAANLIRLEADEGLRRRLAYQAAESVQRFRRERHDDKLIGFLGLD